MFALDGFEIREPVHTGSDTRVFRARRLDDDRPVVLKLPREEFPDHSDIERIRNEYQILRSLEIPDVLQVFELISHHNTVVLVAEDIGGISLGNLLQTSNGPIGLHLFFTLAVKIVQALQRVHDAGLMHGGINPENIIWNRSTEQLRIIDFGFATPLSKRSNGSVLAKNDLPYLSPEQTGRLPDLLVDHRSDLYSLGITLYELLVGVLPFSTDGRERDWVHAHMALTPALVTDVRSGTPEPLGPIIDKLLAKAVADRYQSANGVLADLLACKRSWIEGRAGSDSVGKFDTTERVIVPGTLHGRSTEVASLTAAFARSLSGGVELHLICGPSGIGKTRFLGEMERILSDACHFLGVKCEATLENQCLAAISRASENLARRILAEPAENLALSRSTIIEAVGQDSTHLCEHLPCLAPVLLESDRTSEQSPRPSRSSDLQQAVDAVHRFINSLCSGGRPVVLFLDDIHTASKETKHLVRLLTTSEDSHHLLVVATCRHDETSQLHSLLEDAQESKCTVHQSELPPLSAEALADLVQETLGCARNKADELSEILAAKTLGNPAAVRRFLEDAGRSGILTFDRPANRWHWDAKALTQQEVSASVIDQSIRQMAQLPESTKKLLGAAACLGTRFNLGTVALAANITLRQALNDVMPALRSGVVLENGKNPETRTAAEPGHTFHFLHDAVRDSADQLLDPREREDAHYEIGHEILARIRNDEVDERLFELVGHLNQARTLNREEQLLLAKLNLRSARKAHTSSAYAQALRYFSAAAECLGDDPWATRFEEAFEAQLGIVDCSFALDDSARATTVAESLLQRCRHRRDRVSVSRMLTRRHTARGEYATAIKIGLRSLREYGEHIPRAFVTLRTAVQWTFLKLLRMRRGTVVGKTARRAGNRPDSSVTIEATLDLYLDLVPPAYMSGSPSSALMTLRMSELAVKHGSNRVTAVSYMLLGALLSRQRRDYANALRWRDASVALQQEHPHPSLNGCSLVIDANFIAPWTRPLEEGHRLRRAGINACLESHDYFWALNSFECGFAAELHSCSRLSEVADAVNRLRTLAGRIGHEQQGRLLELQGNFLSILSGDLPIHSFFERHPNQESRITTEFERSHYRVGEFARSSLHITLESLLGNWEGVLELTLPARDAARTCVGQFDEACSTLYTCLAILGTDGHRHGWKGTDANLSKRSCQKLVRGAMAQLAAWRETCPSNFASMHDLAQAALATSEGRPQDATELYAHAMEHARSNGQLLLQCLATQMLAECHIVSRGLTLASAFLNEAIHHYERLGANGMVFALHRKYPELCNRAEVPAEALPPNIDKPHRAFAAPRPDDLETLLQAANRLTQIGDRTQLFEVICDSAIEIAGADHASLVLQRESQWHVAALRTAGETQSGDSPATSLDECLCVPRDAVNYVLNTGEILSIDDAQSTHDFDRDPYISTTSTRSILCVPIRHAGVLIGALHLEHRALAGAFAGCQADLVALLAAQAGLAIANADSREGQVATALEFNPR